jgi:spoIIIJ-associated protein
MANATETIKTMLQKMELDESQVSCDEANRKVSILLGEIEHPFLKANIPQIVQDFNHIAQLIAKKNDEPSFFIDINNYRLERERIITELARAAARKAVATKAEISLPAMNAYERRIIHVELAARPEVKTESVGTGKSRYVIVKFI